MQKSFWWWQCSDRYILSSPSTSIPPPPPPLLPVPNKPYGSVDVKHHVYLLFASRATPRPPALPFSPSLISLMVSVLTLCTIFTYLFYRGESRYWFRYLWISNGPSRARYLRLSHVHTVKGSLLVLHCRKASISPWIFVVLFFNIFALWILWQWSVEAVMFVMPFIYFWIYFYVTFFCFVLFLSFVPLTQQLICCSPAVFENGGLRSIRAPRTSSLQSDCYFQGIRFSSWLLSAYIHYSSPHRLQKWR